jgi:hypothetical protein
MVFSWIWDSRDWVCLRELSRELSTSSRSTSVARDRVQDLRGGAAKRRPAKSVIDEHKDWLLTVPCRIIARLMIIVDMIFLEEERLISSRTISSADLPQSHFQFLHQNISFNCGLRN